jgi:hypothetical protein
LGLLRKPELRALRQRVASSCALRPLNLTEVRAYVAERLHSAGYRGTTNLFPTQVLEQIVLLTEGVPRLLNLLCDACLANGFKSRRPVIDMATVEESASDLGLREVQVELAAGENGTGSAKGTAGNELATDEAVGSALDRLVHAMKKRSALASVADEIRPEMSIKKQVAVTVNAIHEKDPAGNKVIESAVDVLVGAMKTRRDPAMEL